RALHQRADGRSAVRADDQISLPVAGNGPVGSLGRALADHHHGRQEARLALLSTAVRLAHRPAGAQRSGKVAAQLSAALDVERSVDRLVAHVQLRTVGEVPLEPTADLLRTPASVEHVLDQGSQL